MSSLYLKGIWEPDSGEWESIGTIFSVSFTLCDLCNIIFISDNDFGYLHHSCYFYKPLSSNLYHVCTSIYSAASSQRIVLISLSSGLTASGQAQAPGSHIPSALRSVMNLTTRVTSISFHPSGTYRNDVYVFATSVITGLRVFSFKMILLVSLALVLGCCTILHIRAIVFCCCDDFIFTVVSIGRNWTTSACVHTVHHPLTLYITH